MCFERKEKNIGAETAKEKNEKFRGKWSSAKESIRGAEKGKTLKEKKTNLKRKKGLSQKEEKNISLKKVKEKNVKKLRKKVFSQRNN